MSKVVDLTQERENRAPHLVGPAICLKCGHEWVAVAPVGVTGLECPKCGLNTGDFRGLFEPSNEFWRCECGCESFWLTPTGAKCRLCGKIQIGWVE